MENPQYCEPSIDRLRHKNSLSDSDDLIDSSVEIRLENLPKYNNDLDQFDNVANRKRYGNEQTFNDFVSVLFIDSQMHISAQSNLVSPRYVFLLENIANAVTYFLLTDKTHYIYIIVKLK